MSDLLATAHGAPRPAFATMPAWDASSGAGLMAVALTAGVCVTWAAQSAGVDGLGHAAAAVAATAAAWAFQALTGKGAVDHVGLSSTIDMLRDLRERLGTGAFASRHDGHWVVFEAGQPQPRLMSPREYREFRRSGLVDEVVVGPGRLTLRRLWNGVPDSAHTGEPAVMVIDTGSGRLLRSDWCLQGLDYGRTLALQAHETFKVHHEAPAVPFTGHELERKLS